METLHSANAQMAKQRRGLVFSCRSFFTRTILAVAFFVIGCEEFWHQSCFAQWSTDPTSNLIVGFGANPELCSDGAGGCYVTYENSIGYPTQLALERINRYGYNSWPTTRFINGELPDQRFAKITDDGFGGALIAFSDDSIPEFGGTFRIRVQRVDSSGNLLWGATGVRISLSETNQDRQAIVADGLGGCIVVWVDTLGNLMINRIDNAGTRMWGDSGKYVWNSPAQPILATDMNGGCFLAYSVGRLQRYGYDGNPYWLPGGILTHIAAIDIEVDESLSVYLFGQRVLGEPSRSTLNLQKVTSSGSLPWDSLGVIIDTVNTFTLRMIGLSAQDSHLSLGWINDSDGHDNLFAQFVRRDGSRVFPSGISVTKVISTKLFVDVVSSATNSAMFVWTDYRAPQGTYLQRLDTLGHVILDSTDIPLSFPELTGAKAVDDGNGGLIVVGSREAFSIRAQQANKLGNLGEVIVSADVGNLPMVLQVIELSQNYPNPSNATTVIRFEIHRRSNVRLILYTLLGQELQTLVNRMYEPGAYSVLVDMGNLASGIYLYELQTQNGSLLKKISLVK